MNWAKVLDIKIYFCSVVFITAKEKKIFSDELLTKVLGNDIEVDVFNIQIKTENHY